MALHFVLVGPALPAEARRIDGDLAAVIARYEILSD
jgi:hypothetical protein